jgi:Ca2+-binding EF-hand superfamily protein
LAMTEHLHKAFGYFDWNQSGYVHIETDELREALAND